jgi:hypothetical protein
MDTATLKNLLEIVQLEIDDVDIDDTTKVAIVRTWLVTIGVMLEAKHVSS